jgi:hypothetical protein
MVRSLSKIDVYLEIGKKRTFAGVFDWPGWCRSGRDEESALQALFDYGPRYARVLGAARLGFQAPADAAAFAVIERLEGNATTDFGAPGVAPSSDTRPVEDAELERFQTLLKACWRTFDTAVRAATGKELRKGPRGGGRDLGEIVDHVVGSDAGYLARLGWKLEQGEADDPGKELGIRTQHIVEILRGGPTVTTQHFSLVLARFHDVLNTRLVHDVLNTIT